MTVKLETIQKAAKRFQDEGIKGVLVGTTGLYLHGFDVKVKDIDFLVERAPKMTPEEENDKESIDGDAASAGLRTIMDYTPVDYIDLSTEDKRRRRFFTPNPVIIHGVPVASVDDIIGLKRSADREKDRYWLAGWDAARSKR